MNENKKKYDFVKKSWGYYATLSMNGSLKKEGFKTVLVKNKSNKYYIMVVEKTKMSDFKKYCKTENQAVIEQIACGNRVGYCENPGEVSTCLQDRNWQLG